MLRLNWKSLLGAVCLLGLCFQITVAQQRTGSLRGQVSDELGALVVGATVTLIAADGSGKRVLAPVPESFPGQDSDPDRAFQWDPDSTGITFLTRAATLWHVTLDGAAKQLDGSSITEFARLGSQ